ncbi:MAG: DUF115 domain-containing protein [Rhodocyclaceae bacterium]|nr:DUF115 domain-containing protein [Rhodocyclaceae bacterium]
MTHRLSQLYGRHAGERAVLVANGPSLNRMNLDFLRSETVIGMNKIFLGFRKYRFYPRYYVAVNRNVIEQSFEEIRAINCIKFISCRGADLNPENALTYHIETQNPPARFSRDITMGLHEGWTVTYAALQIAHYLGFGEVVIVGMDHRYECSGAPNEASRLDGPDPNHFCPDYFGGGRTWNNPDLARSEESYQIARAEFEKDGRRIIDATLDGACAIFEKADYRQIFGVAP